MKFAQITLAARLFSLVCCMLLLPSCKLVSSIVKLPVNIVKSTASMVGVSNLTDHPAQPVSNDSATGAETKEIDAQSASRKLD